MSPPLLGAHCSIAGGLHKALRTAAALDCTALQLFTGNARTWKERMPAPDMIDRFGRVRAETGIKEIAAHTAYLINLASPDEQTRQRSIHALAAEMERSSRLGVPWVVLHPGSHGGAGVAVGTERIADGINRVLDQTGPCDTRLLLETTAGQGTGIGHTFEQLAEIIERVEASEQIGVCIDTCHIFGAGYDIRTETAYEKTMTAFDRVLGLDRLRLIHLNDSKRALGSRVDRHEHIGKGEIGIEGFRLIMTDPRLERVPKIIETPAEGDKELADRRNLDRLRTL